MLVTHHLSLLLGHAVNLRAMPCRGDGGPNRRALAGAKSGGTDKTGPRCACTAPGSPLPPHMYQRDVPCLRPLAEERLRKSRREADRISGAIILTAPVKTKTTKTKRTTSPSNIGKKSDGLLMQISTAKRPRRRPLLCSRACGEDATLVTPRRKYGTRLGFVE